MEWRSSLSNEQRAARRAEVATPGTHAGRTRLGGQEWVKQLTDGLLIAGILAGPGVYPERPRPDPELGPTSC